jgi:hypothetical protein
MKIIAGCFNNINSIIMKDRINETVFTYDMNYQTYEIDADIPEKNRIFVMECPVCKEKFTVKIRNKINILLRQSIYLFVFLSTLPISIIFFNMAKHDNTNGFWVIAILFFIFGCVITGTLVFNIKKNEFGVFIHIPNRNNLIKIDDKMNALKHKLFDKNYLPFFKSFYYLLIFISVVSGLIYFYFLCQVVIYNNSFFIPVAISLFVLLIIGLPIFFLLNHLYDKFLSKERRLK